jgi:glutamate-5-semialdehyde dehydrogenase
LPDPVGEVLEGFTRANGLEIKKVRVPLGVVGMIYEARPNVTIDAAGLCLKSGNSVVLRGGSEAVNSNRKMVEILRRVLNKKGVDEAAISFIDNTDRQAVDVMMNQKGIIDVLIPRGGAGLIKKVVEGSRVPVIETGAGVCHVYVDKAADLDMAERIVINAKVSRPAVCNAMETLLIHEDVAAEFLPPILRSLKAAGVEIRGCNRTIHFDDEINAAEASDWATEYNDLILSVKIVSTIDEAIDHINRYNTKHSETIVTNDYNRARRFQKLVDAAVVYVNASTRFTDGFEFGFGAEIGISTQKLHARGPMGLRELTTTKYLVCGDGQIRA